MKLFYGKGAYLRNNGNLPRLALINMFVESSASSDDGVVLLSRKGLAVHATRGTGPIRGVFQQAGVFGGDEFCVSGSTLYRGASSIGTISGSGPVSFAAGSANELAINAGGPIYRYDGSTLVAVAFPDSASVRKITFHDGLYLAVRDGSHKFYWSAVLDADTWNALSFASAESRPDALLDLAVNNDMLWLFGEETTEPWANTGEADLPYQRQELALLSKGIKATGCVVPLDQALCFVGHDNTAYVLRGGAPERISDHGIEEQIAGSATVSCFGYLDDGHAFFCIRLDDATFAFDMATRQWCELQTWGRANFRGQCATAPGDTAIFGDDETGTLYTLSGWKDGADPLERRFTAAIALQEPAVVDAIRLWANVGWTELLAGQGYDPQVELRSSRDAGATWGNWRSSPLGKQGDYRTRTEWRRLGMFDDPGAMFEMRLTDPVPFRVSSVIVPEQRGGRSR